MKIEVDTINVKNKKLTGNLLLIYSLALMYSEKIDRHIEVRDVVFELGITRQAAKLNLYQLVAMSLLNRIECEDNKTVFEIKKPNPMQGRER